MAYLLASDFDGTLIHWPSGKIDKEDREAIKRFREKGNKLVVVTGRMYGAAIDGFKSTDFYDMDCFLCLSGAIAAQSDGTVIYDKRVPLAGIVIRRCKISIGKLRIYF